MLCWGDVRAPARHGRRWGACGFVGVSASASARVRYLGQRAETRACVRTRIMYGCSLRSATGSLHVCMYVCRRQNQTPPDEGRCRPKRKRARRAGIEAGPVRRVVTRVGKLRSWLRAACHAMSHSA